MTPQVFTIKSLLVQNAIMAGSLGLVLFFLGRALVKRSRRQVLVMLLWVGATVGFFNSPWFGFSKVVVGREGIVVHYGFLSWRNTVLPLDTAWQIEERPSGLKRLSRIYILRLDGHRSMGVKGKKGEALLRRIGMAIQEAQARFSLLEKAPHGLSEGTFSFTDAGLSTGQLLLTHVEIPSLGSR